MGRACIEGGNEDVAFINCAFDSGTIAHVELSWLAPSKLRRTTIVGSKKMVVYDDCSNEPVRVYDSGVMPRNPESFGEYLKYRTGDIVSPHIRSCEPIALQIDDFCRAIRSGSTPRSSARLGLDVVRMIEAAERSHMHNGRSGSRTGKRAWPISEVRVGAHGMTNAEPIRARAERSGHSRAGADQHVPDAGRAGLRLLRQGSGGRPAPPRRRRRRCSRSTGAPTSDSTWRRHHGFAGRCGATATTSCTPTTGCRAPSRPCNSRRRS